MDPQRTPSSLTAYLRAFIGIAAASREYGPSWNTLRAWCDHGLVRSMRDPANRRLIERASLLERLRQRRTK